jgi:hypothetical protein
MRRHHRHILSAIILIIASAALMVGLARAQGGATVTVTGTLNSVSSDGVIVVDGVTYRLGSGVSLPAGTVVGVKITITGQTSGNTQVIIITRVQVVNATATPTGSPPAPATSPATASATAPATSPATVPATAPATVVGSPDIIIVVQGPVRAKRINIITIFDFNIQMAPDDPMLTVIKIGDVLHVKGSPNKSGLLVAIQVSNVVARATGGTALVEGRVQAINVNVVTINGINVHLAPTDPRLKTLRVGNYLSVSGNFERRGTMVVLIVVNLIIISDDDVDIFIWCREHHGMGMGMGMGEPPRPGMGMGMGEPPPPGMGMGMGDPDDECHWH